MVFPRSKKIIFEGQKAPDKHVSWSESRSKVMPSTNPWTERLRLCGWTWFGVSPQRETAVSSAHRSTSSSVASEESSAAAPHTRLWCPSTWSSAECRSVCVWADPGATPPQHVKCGVVMHEHVCSLTSQSRQTAVSSARGNTTPSAGSGASWAVVSHTRPSCPSTWSSAGSRSVLISLPFISVTWDDITAEAHWRFWSDLTKILTFICHGELMQLIIPRENYVQFF